MRVGVKYCRAKTMSRIITIIVVLLRDLKRKRSNIVNDFVLREDFLLKFFLYWSWKSFISSTVKSGFQIPFIFAMSIRCLQALQGLFLVMRLIGVSLKKTMKMIVQMRRGTPKKNKLTFQKSGMRQNQRTLVRAPALKIEATTILKFCLLFYSTISVIKMQVMLKGTMIDPVIKKSPPVPNQIFQLKVATRMPVIQIIIPPTMRNFDLTRSPTAADKRLPTIYPAQNIVLMRSRVACSSGQRQSPNLFANEVIVLTVGRQGFLASKDFPQTKSRQFLAEWQSVQTQASQKKRKGVIRRMPPANIDMADKVKKRDI